MEQIKRANNMWTNDSLFLREYLLIPFGLAVNSGQGNGTSAPLVNGGGAISKVPKYSQPPGCEIVTKQELQAASKLSRSCSENTISQSQNNAKLDSGDSASDFLSKFDCSLAKIKTNVQKLEETTEFPDDPSNPLNHLPQRRSSHNYGVRYKTRSMDVSVEDLSTEPHMMFKSRGATRYIRSSLEQLDKANDDIFEL